MKRRRSTVLVLIVSALACLLAVGFFFRTCPSGHVVVDIEKKMPPNDSVIKWYQRGRSGETVSASQLAERFQKLKKQTRVDVIVRDPWFPKSYTEANPCGMLPPQKAESWPQVLANLEQQGVVAVYVTRCCSTGGSGVKAKGFLPSLQGAEAVQIEGVTEYISRLFTSERGGSH